MNMPSTSVNLRRILKGTEICGVGTWKFRD